MNALFKLFEKEIVWPDVYEDAVWYENYNEVAYNLAGNTEQLFSQEGDTYGGEVRGLPVKRGGYVIYTLDSCQGFDYQVILKLENQVGYD